MTAGGSEVIGLTALQSFTSYMKDLPSDHPRAREEGDDRVGPM